MNLTDISTDDRGLLLGVGLFETVLFIDGAPCLWEAHVDRLRHGCAELALPAPEAAALAEAAAAALNATGLGVGRAAVRLTWTGGGGGRGLADPDDVRPRLLASAALAPAPWEGLTLVTSEVRRNPTSPTSRLKTLSYLDSVVARRRAVAAGADEALCLDTAGRVACAAAGNVFWLEGEQICTPAPSCGVLPGVVRAEVLRLAPRFGLTPRLVEVGPERLHRADAAFVTNSLIGIVPIHALDGVAVALAPERLGELRSALSE